MKSKQFYSNLRLGILGGGQLGRILIQAGIDFNLDFSILDPATEAPCRAFSKSFTQGSLTDYQTVMDFAVDLDLISVEIENVNVKALRDLAEMGKRIFPHPDILEMIQDKYKQKCFLEEHNIPTSPFVRIENKADLWTQKDRLPGVFKLSREGYDGRGVQILHKAEDIENAFDAAGLLEEFVDFEKELGIIVARSFSGEIKTYAPVEMSFHPEHNLVEYLLSPAEISPEQAAQADRIARDLAEKLDYVGVLAVELFLRKDGSLWVNELAPRPHNSGHQSIRANQTSQYEQHLRAGLDLPLGSTAPLCPSAMINILGTEGYTGPASYSWLKEALSIPGVYPHLYGKKESRPFRKMGHIIVLDEDAERLKQKVQEVRGIMAK